VKRSALHYIALSYYTSGNFFLFHLPRHSDDVIDLTAAAANGRHHIGARFSYFISFLRTTRSNSLLLAARLGFGRFCTSENNRPIK
jgi:hypothetical protein